MKNILLIITILVFVFACNTSKKVVPAKNETIKVKTGDTIKISGDNLEYDVIIIEPGFGSWLERMAKPTGYYSLEFLKSKNRIFVSEWNRRVLQTSQQYMNLYQMQINYNFNTNYGYEVNYKLYNYFIYFQIRYKQQLSGILPKI